MVIIDFDYKKKDKKGKFKSTRHLLRILKPIILVPIFWNTGLVQFSIEGIVRECDMHERLHV